MTIKREMAIWSTAIGYDIKVCLIGERGEYALRVYRNVTAATMRRFYKVSESYMTFHAAKQVSWRRYRVMFA